MPRSLVEHLDCWLGHYSPKANIAVALSGGVDSVALLHALAHTTFQPQIKALHVHHGLQPQADGWEAHCRALSGSLRVAYQSCRVDVAAESGASLEARARRARYRALARYLNSGDLLLTAHHADDQAETLLLNLMRGSGVEGLAAMPEIKPMDSVVGARHGRPLLDFSKAELERYAQQQQLKWVEDDSNCDSQFDRNYLRQQVMPLLQKRWPRAAESIADSAGHLQPVRRRELAYWRQQCESLAQSEGRVLPTAALENLDKPDRLSLLRTWLRDCDPAPRLKTLLAIDELCYSPLGEREQGSGTVAWGAQSKCAVSRFQKALYRRREAPQQVEASTSPARLLWQTQSEQAVEGLTRPLSRQWCEEQGINIEGYQQLSVCWRGDAPSKDRVPQPKKGGALTQKAYYQAFSVPPWLRDSCPYLYDGQQLIGILIDWGKL